MAGTAPDTAWPVPDLAQGWPAPDPAQGWPAPDLAQGWPAPETGIWGGSSLRRGRPATAPSYDNWMDTTPSALIDLELCREYIFVLLCFVSFLTSFVVLLSAFVVLQLKQLSFELGSSLLVVPNRV